VIRDVLAAAVGDALESLGVTRPDEVHLERPAHREHGDWSSNIALASAKVAGRNPRELAAELIEALSAMELSHVSGIEIAGPGFVNFRLNDSWLHEVLGAALSEGDGFGRPNIGNGKKVMVEFVSSNPTGPLHAGHASNACYGDALAGVFTATGHDVSREFYINDRGTQMRIFGESLSALKAGKAVAEDGYGGEYMHEWAALMPDDVDPYEWGYDHSLNYLKETLRRLGVEFDSWFSERSMVESGAIETTLADLRKRGVVDERDGAVWLRSTDFGDDKDRVLVRSDGQYTYVLPDIAYHRDKFERGFELVVDVFGADHHGYVARLKAAVAALGHDPDELEVRITQLVRLERDGQEVRLGKRSGELVELADIIDEVGPDATRFSYLIQSIDSHMTIDLAAISAKTMDNPVFYVQMAHARACSIQRRAAAAGVAPATFGGGAEALLTHERELEVLRVLSELSDVLGLAARERAPHKLVTWVRELASAFHGFFADCYVIADSVPGDLAAARLMLVEAGRIGLASGLEILGVTAPEEM
jgi:arginyl-tRNA synthetase